MEEELKYPIGKFEIPAAYSPQLVKNYISEISILPEKIRREVIHLTADQLDTAYRPGGWTIRQVVNHLSDSHMNALIRFKLALTEETPVIKPYHEQYWAELADSKTIDIHAALMILDGVHSRWSVLMNSLKEKEWDRSFVHPEKGREIRLKESAGSYAWHGNHHLAHITRLKTRNGWK
jgi:hypothetical protein